MADDDGFTTPAALQAQLDAIYARRNAPRAPTYSPEQVSQRRSDVNDQELLGMLSMLSGNQAMQGLGGTILKKTMALREKKIGEHGSSDQITGEYTPDPGYLSQRDDERERLIQSQIATLQDRDVARRQRSEDKNADRELRKQLAADALETRKLTAAAGGKLPAEVGRMMIGFNALNSTLDEYEDAIKGLDPHNPKSWATPALRAKFKGLIARLTLEGKEGGALGALSESDLGLMHSLFMDPFSQEGLKWGKEGLLGSLDQGRKWANARSAGTAKQYNLPFTPYARPDPNAAQPDIVPPVDVGALLAAQPAQALPKANPRPIKLPPMAASAPPVVPPAGMPPPMSRPMPPQAPQIGPDGRPLQPMANPLAQPPAAIW